ncbi:hypothetical protein GCM10010302_05530 [Streptomyces polychromogenes]|uniref:Uncharacterized protein n=1 Tax=Streptomyces polychromogenes TaxID=67342 RepID=A0ABP3EQD3_9ACTN
MILAGPRPRHPQGDRCLRRRSALALDLPARHGALEEHIGHKFREKLSVAAIVAEAARIEAEPAATERPLDPDRIAPRTLSRPGMAHRPRRGAVVPGRPRTPRRL